MKIYHSIFTLIVVCLCFENVRSQGLLTPLYRWFRDTLYIGQIGKTINDPELLQRAKSAGRIQKEMPSSFKFPCADYLKRTNDSNSNLWEGPRSKKRPTSVHTLRPGDIDVIAALGDSLTTGNGAGATNVLHLQIENRGVTWSIGGYGAWKKYFTLPNMLKVFNPKLIGYSYGDSYAHHRANQFNIAEIMAMSKDMPFQARELIKRLKNDPRVDMKQDWKLITILIGANDFCSEACYFDDPRDIIEKHQKDLHTTLSIIKDNIPRVLVNLVPGPDVTILSEMFPRPIECEVTLRYECPCIVGEPQKPKRKLVKKLIKKWQQIDMEISDLPEFNDKEDFTVISQPFTTDITIPRDKNGQPDLTFFSTDCFHFSQKAHARAANALWNNMFEPVGVKSDDWNDLFDIVKCPTVENPYIYTRINSVRTKQNYLDYNTLKRNLKQV